MSSTAPLLDDDFAVREEPSTDRHGRLRALYRTLIEDQRRFDEFQRFLSLYDPPADGDDEESDEAYQLRSQLNERIRAWIGPFEGLDVMQVRQWKEIIVDQRVNIAIAPWKQSNLY